MINKGREHDDSRAERLRRAVEGAASRAWEAVYPADARGSAYYVALRVAGTCRLLKYDVASGEIRAVDPRLDLFRHSPTGYEWSYSGSGPAQTAIAILADRMGKDQEERAVRLHQRFKEEVVAGAPREGWAISAEHVDEIVAELEREAARLGPARK